MASVFGMGIEIFDRALKTPSMAENALLTRLNRYGVQENIERYQFDLIQSLEGKVKNYIFSRDEINEKISNVKINKNKKNALINEKKLIEKKIINLIQSSKYKYVGLFLTRNFWIIDDPKIYKPSSFNSRLSSTADKSK